LPNRRLMVTLGYAGLLPFYGFLVGSWWLRDWPAALSVQGFVIYSLGILCFLGGTLWGRVQRLDEPGTARLIISNGVVLFAVAAVLTAQAWLAALALMIAYVALAWYESRSESLPHWYLRLRITLTAGVVIAHILFFVAQSVQAST